jgi:hypothetical protein
VLELFHAKRRAADGVGLLLVGFGWSVTVSCTRALSADDGVSDTEADIPGEAPEVASAVVGDHLPSVPLVATPVTASKRK